MDEIITAISSVGFPIIMSILLFTYLRQQNELHREETNGLKDAITELKIAITTLITKIGD